jgi:hypothetical protein
VAYAEVPRGSTTRRSPSSRDSGGGIDGDDDDMDDDLVASAVDAVLAAAASASAASTSRASRGSVGIRRAASQEDQEEPWAEVPSSSKRGWHLFYDEHCTYLPAVSKGLGSFPARRRGAVRGAAALVEDSLTVMPLPSSLCFFF